MPYLHKRSTVSGVVPTAGALVLGEVAMNAFDGKLFLKKTDGVVVEVNAAGTIAGATLASNVLASSLTSVGTLAALTVTAPITGSVTGSAGTVTNPNLTGEVTTSGTTATLANSAVIGKVLTGYTSGAGAVAATDTILQAIQKLNGNAGVIDHGLLTGLADDDHAQYHNDARGDARYSLLSHTHAGADITTGTVAYARLPTGTTASTVAIGDHTHNLDALTDVVITSVVAENGLVFDGTNWVNQPTQYHHYLTADNPLTNGTAQQPWFATANDGISLPAGSVWRIQGQLILQSGTTTHITSVGFPFVTAGVAPTGKVTCIVYATAAFNALVRAQDLITFSTMAGGAINTTTTTANHVALIDGQFHCTDLGTMTPSLTFSAAPGGTNLTLQGSYITLTRMGSTSDVHNGGWA